MDFYHDDLLKILISLLLGGFIGAEREYRSKAAGFRTIILICVGSTLFTIISLQVGKNVSPDRIAANIITGIGFLGAGVIFKDDKGSVSGLTSATTIWISAAIGMAVGAGYFMLSFIITIITLIILLAFIALQNYIDKINQGRIYHITCQFQDDTLQKIENLFKLHHLRPKRGKQKLNGTTLSGVWNVQGRKDNHEKVLNDLLSQKDIVEIEF